MAGLIMLAIHLYRRASRFLPCGRTCLFAESCSRHVERMVRHHGSRAGLRAFRDRWTACRPGYSFEFADHGWKIICADGSVIAGPETSAAVHGEAAACRLALPA